MAQQETPSTQIYLVGTTWCGYTKKADAELAAASSLDPSMQVQQYAINDVVTRVFCDQPSRDAPVPQLQLCALAKGYPILAACEGDNCTTLLDGYFPNYPKVSADAVNRYANQ